jgi:DNA-directed RNA polymerase specialized sigma subunit
MFQYNEYIKFIKYLSRKISRIYYNSYLSYEDYFQIGSLALWKSQNKWKSEKGEFGKYAKTAIFYAITNEAIKSLGIFYAPFLDKNLSIKIRNYLNNGKTESDVCKLLSISYERLQELKRISMSKREIYIDIREQKCPLDLLELKDLLSEEEVDSLLTNDTTKTRIQKWRMKNRIKEKLNAN